MGEGDDKGRGGGPKGRGQDVRTRRARWAGLVVTYVLFAALGVALLQPVIERARQTDQIPYSTFLAELEAGNVASVTVSDERVTGTFVEPVDGDTRFITRRVDPDLSARLDKAGVEFDGSIEGGFFDQLLSWLIPIALFGALWWFVIRRAAQSQMGGGGLMQVGKSKAKITVEDETGTSFDDVAGIDETETELREIVAFLKDPASFGRLGAHVPKGVLLAGPPGTGKTLIARAVAGEAAVPFFYVNGSEFVEMFVGVGAARVRDLFRQARERAPCIIFVDELDALGAARGGSVATGGGNDEKEQTLNQLLVELDGFDPTEGLVVIAATNRAEVLDQALLRAGRFDRRVMVNRPDRQARREILDVHLAKIVPAEDLDRDRVAELTPGFTGADIENLVNEAAIVATRRGAESVETADFTAAIERLIAGPEKKNSIMSEAERERVAYHELGHAITAMRLPGTDPVQKVSIVPRTVGALGYTLQRPTGDRYLMTKGELVDKMTVLLGGRAAEAIFFDEVSTGAQDDLQKVSEIARAIVTQYGMTEELGLLAYESPNDQRATLIGPSDRHGGGTVRAIDATARKIVDDAYAEARRLIGEHASRMHEAARRLIEVETVGEDELRRIFGLDAAEGGVSGDSDRAGGDRGHRRATVASAGAGAWPGSRGG